MLDLKALVDAVAGQPAGPVRLPAVPRVRVAEGCALRCPDCVAASSRGSVEREIVQHALSVVAATFSRVLFAGADPLTSSTLPEAVQAARALGLAVEVLTPGVLLTDATARHCRRMGIERLRVSVDPARVGFKDSLRGAAASHSVGLPVDLQLTVQGTVEPAWVQWISCLATLPVERILVATDSCQTPTTPVAQWVAMRVATDLLASLRQDGGPAVCVEGDAFHERLVCEAVERIAGRDAGQQAGRLLIGDAVRARRARTS